MKVTAKSVNLRQGDDLMNCGTCQNWGSDGTCSVLGKATLQNQVCDSFIPLEQEAAAPAAPVASIPPQDVMSQLFGAG